MRNFKSSFFALLLALPLLMLLSGCEKFLDRKPLTATLEDLNQGDLSFSYYLWINGKAAEVKARLFFHVFAFCILKNRRRLFILSLEMNLGSTL